MIYVQQAGLLLAVFCYLICAGLTFSSKAKGTIRTVFIFSFLLISLWALGYFIFADVSQSYYLGLAPILESLFMMAWLLFLLAVFLGQEQIKVKFSRHKYVWFLLGSVAIFNLIMYSPFFTQSDKYKILVSSELLFSITTLILLEQIYRHSGDAKWAFKPLVLALASLSIFHLVIMSNALLLNQFEVEYLLARPFVVALISPFIILSMKRVENWNLRVFISREVVLHSSLLVFAGIYLVAMATTGYYIKETGKEWSGVIQVTFIAGALIVLAYIFISDTFRKYFRTFIQKHFYANQFEYREEWLKLAKILDDSRPDDDYYQVGLKGICNSLHYSGGCYFKVNDAELVLTTQDPYQLSMEAKFELNALRRKLEQNKWFIDISEFGGKDYIEEFHGYSVAHLSAYDVEIVAPIFIDDEMHGIFVLSSGKNDKVPLNWEVRDYLTVICSQIGSYFRFCEARVKLEENAKFAAFNRMSAFVVHDLKNVIAQIGMIVTNAEKHRDNPEFIDDTFETLTHTKERMDRMLKQLKEKQQHRSLSAQHDLVDVLTKLCQEYSQELPKPQFHSTLDTCFATIDLDRFNSVIGHLIDNAQHATADDGEVSVEVKQNEQQILVVISDSGIGMSEDFINNLLFKPFETTKGNAGMGVGVYEAKSFAEELSGSLQVSSQPNKGSVFTMALPLRNVSE